MQFSIILRECSLISPNISKESQLELLLYSIGYINKGYRPRTKYSTTIFESVPYRLAQLFFENPTNTYDIDELYIHFDTPRFKASKKTIYRHLKKLVKLELVEKVKFRASPKGRSKVGYRLANSNIYKAWHNCKIKILSTLELYDTFFQYLEKYLHEKNNGKIRI